jgi:ABC-type polysaccharide/polyol phosphate export permease
MAPVLVILSRAIRTESGCWISTTTAAFLIVAISPVVMLVFVPVVETHDSSKGPSIIAPMTLTCLIHHLVCLNIAALFRSLPNIFTTVLAQTRQSE